MKFSRLCTCLGELRVAPPTHIEWAYPPQPHAAERRRGDVKPDDLFRARNVGRLAGKQRALLGVAALVDRQIHLREEARERQVVPRRQLPAVHLGERVAEYPLGLGLGSAVGAMPLPIEKCDVNDPALAALPPEDAAVAIAALLLSGQVIRPHHESPSDSLART